MQCIFSCILHYSNPELRHRDKGWQSTSEYIPLWSNLDLNMYVGLRLWRRGQFSPVRVHWHRGVASCCDWLLWCVHAFHFYQLGSAIIHSVSLFLLFNDVTLYDVIVAITCPPLPRWKYVTAVDVTGGQLGTVGSVVNYTCQSGYTFTLTPSVTYQMSRCHDNGIWLPVIQFCSAAGVATEHSQIHEAYASDVIGLVSLLLCTLSIFLLIILDVMSIVSSSSGLVSVSGSRSTLGSGIYVQQTGVKDVKNHQTSLL